MNASCMTYGINFYHGVIVTQLDTRNIFRWKVQCSRLKDDGSEDTPETVSLDIWQFVACVDTSSKTVPYPLYP